MEDLTPLFGRWMRAAIGSEIPRETVATCGTCVMTPGPRGEGGGLTATPTSYFDSGAKCCTFLPEMVNFLVGGVLADADNSPDGTASIEARIDAGVEVTPLGLGRPRSFLLVYDEVGEATFGRARSLRCPHYLETDGGRCGVWKHRASTCATWFCKHVRGATGAELWKVIHRTLRIVEQDLSWWCVRKLGLDPESIRALQARQSGGSTKRRVDAHDLDGTRDPMHGAIWGAWHRREREFYRACAEEVAALEWSDVLRVARPELGACVDVARALLGRSSAEELPPRLALAAFTVVAIRDDAATLTTYSPYDPITLPLELLAVLDQFDGRPTTAVLDRLRRERDVELDSALVRRLLDFGVLKPVDPM